MNENEFDRIKKRGYMVVKDNQLIQKARYDLTALQQKLLCFVISKIKPRDKEFERYTISALEFAELAGIDKRHIYSDFKKMIDELDAKAQWIKIGDDTIKFRIFSEACYNNKQGSISVILNSQLKKYLLELSHNYAMYELWNILSLKSKYSVRLYELFKSYAYQREITTDFDTLKGLLCAEHYKLYSKFKERVLEKSVREINEFTNLSVVYNPQKKGRSHKVSAITFTITEKKSFEAYKAYRQSVARINKKGNQIEGQMSLFEMKEEDFM